jgi:hypothetical protein
MYGGSDRRFTALASVNEPSVSVGPRFAIAEHKDERTECWRFEKQFTQDGLQ